MKASIPTILTFTIPLVIIAVGYYIAVNVTSRPLNQELLAESPLLVRYSYSDVILDPTAEFWETIEPTRIHLFPQTVRIPYGTEERDIWVRGVYNDREIGFLLEYGDSTKNSYGSLNSDGCAIMFVHEDSPATAQMMGHAAEANIWHWLANIPSNTATGDSAVPAIRELIASGPGTQTVMPLQNVSGRGTYDDNKWRVLFLRQLDSQQEGEFALSPGRGSKIAFAVWDGALKESFSRKSIAILRDLKLEAH